MCTFIDSEVVLLYSLCHDDDNHGVEYQDIRNYCARLKQLLFEKGGGNVKCVSFQVSKNSLDENVQEYPKLFRSFAGRYYRGIGYDPEYFNMRNHRDINQTLKAAVQ